MRGRILGVDPGSKRLGIAISDENQTVAVPLEAIEVSGTTHLERLARLVVEKDIAEVLVGLPLSLDGSEGSAAKEARKLVDLMKEVLEVPIKMMDERMTTIEAAKGLTAAGASGRKARKVIDSAAATVLLQSYMKSNTK